MIKKLSIFALLVSLFSGCDVITDEETSYEEVVNLAYATDIGKQNKSGYGYTFTAVSNSDVKKVSKYSISYSISRRKYAIYVDIAKHLEDNNLIIKNAKGDYVLKSENSTDVDDDNIYEYRKIFIAEDPDKTVEENSEAANEIFDKLKEEDNPVEAFSDYAIKYSSDTTTSSNGGYIGPVLAEEIDESTLEALSFLENDTIFAELIIVDGGYNIVMLVDKYEKETDEEEEAYALTISFETTGREFDSYVFDNKNDTYSVVTKNDYISVSTVVREEEVNKALYNTIVTARSISINDEIATNILINPSQSNSSSELFNLNAVNEGLNNQITSTYKQEFSTTLSEQTSGAIENTLTFDTTRISEEEYNKRKK